MKLEVKTKKSKHYQQRKCPLCHTKVVHLRCHVIAIHSTRNERIPATKVEAILQASKHGNELCGGKVQNKNKDGTVRFHQCRKVVCPLCFSVTCYLSTHLQRVHKFKRGSKGYQDALKNKRNYMGKKKEL